MKINIAIKWNVNILKIKDSVCFEIWEWRVMWHNFTDYTSAELDSIH